MNNANNANRDLSWSLAMIIACMLLCNNGFAGSHKQQNWKDIAVNLHANHPIQVTKKINTDASGLKRLDIILSNNGAETTSIDSIEIKIPIQVPINSDMKVSYGSSSMGARPVLVHKVGEPQKASYSYMYAMIQQAHSQYVFAGALSWRIFIPIITLEKNVFIIRSKGEGKQLKPGQSIHYEQIVLGLASNWPKVLDTYDNEGNVIVQTRRPEGPDKDRVYIDYSHPGARAHMAKSIRVITKEFGIPYIKIDFILLGLNSEILKANPNFKSIKPFDPSITDVERVRLGLQTIRQEAGPETYLLGCSAVFGPCFGFVDGMRTGGDINPRFEAFSERVLANMGNYYLNGRVFNGDADYLVFREEADEDAGVSEEKTKRGGSMTFNEAQMWADFNKLYGSFRLSSDKLLTLRAERKALIKEVFEFPEMDEMVPLDFWQHGKDKQDGYELILARHGKDIYLGIFNWSDVTKEYNLSAFECGTQKLNARHSKILKYTGSRSFAKIRRALAKDLNKRTH